MKKLSFYFPLLFLIVLVGFSSCTIKKRIYQPGYYVDWHNVNRKTKSNPKNESSKVQESICTENIVAEKNVEKIEDFIQPIAIQELKPVYASNDVNTNNIEIINSTKQKNTFTKIEIVASEVHESVIKEKTTKAPEINKRAKKVHWAAIVGLALSILSFFSIYIIGLGAFLVCIAAIVFSGIAWNSKIKNPEKYCGNGLAIAGIILGMLNLLYTTFIILWVIFAFFI